MSTPSSEQSNSSDAARQSQGRKFEQQAARFYEQNGYTILERNWRTGHKELDLIARKGELIVFVEVKSTRSRKFGHPAERIDVRKRRNLTAAARQYLIAHQVERADLRFDVVTFFDGKLEHYPDAFPAERE